MFEKDVLQLIRGLRAHKGQEREYVQSALRECRKEIKSQDMDVKAVALLKLVYLEMFGNDMSWAAFNVLEVMSSQKFIPKRVGYLAAVQSFRPDTEVLMLAENLLKKDLGNTDKNTISLALSTIPHLVNPSMANSLLTDLLPRLSHSNPRIRKKTIVTLYRLAVVYPEVLRPAWPKVKERLLDENEDPSVTAAIVNVVCELSWRRPQEFLSLAPRLFELLTQSSNNWMAIKIIKLFSVLTPVEPRLVKKLLPPLTQLIRSTPAMSLLYECINGIIQGGIMEAAEGTREGDEIARLCTEKLRGMLAVQDDPNLRYVALLAFNKLASSHPAFVAEHQDVLLECLDDPDISIRTRALELIIGMISQDNLQAVVERLLRQLRTAGVPDTMHDQRPARTSIEPLADEDDEEVGQTLRKDERSAKQLPPLPDQYRMLVIEHILEICSKDLYANIIDFEWYTGILMDLIKQCRPGANAQLSSPNAAEKIGAELLNLAVRIRELRSDIILACQALLINEDKSQMPGWQGLAGAVAFIVGEYAALLSNPSGVVTALSNTVVSLLPAAVLATCLQAIPKVFSALSSNDRHWRSPVRRSELDLLVARVLHFLDPLVLHPVLEVQERAVEYLELFKLIQEAAKTASDGKSFEAPLLFSHAIPAMFSGMELNPVAASAVHQVPIVDGLDLDTPINPSLVVLLQNADAGHDHSFLNNDELHKYYYERLSLVRSTISSSQRPAAERLVLKEKDPYQAENQALDPESAERARAERRERHKDDPYYIDSGRNSGTSTPLGHAIRSATNGDELDVEAIPVIKLQLGNLSGPSKSEAMPQPKKKKHVRRFQVAGDETLGPQSNSGSVSSIDTRLSNGRSKKSLLQVDSSGLSAFNLDNTSGTTTLDVERRAQEEEDMARAIKEVERLRLAMQRRSEGIVDPSAGEGTVVKRSKKKVRTDVIKPNDLGEVIDSTGATDIKEKKKKKKKPRDITEDAVEDIATKPNRRKKRVITLDEQPG